MNLSELPLEVVEVVAEYLSLSDLIACSNTSKQWRNAFNCNRVWKKFCTFHPNYFSKQNSKLGFPDSNDWCVAKEAVLKERFLQHNVKKGKYHVTEVELGALICKSVTSHVDDVGNHWIFVSCLKGDIEVLPLEDMLQVWNMNEVPTLHSCIETAKIETPLYSVKIKIRHTKVFYFMSEEVLVYDFSYPQYELKLLYKIEPFLDLKYDPIYDFKEKQLVWCTNMIVGFLPSIKFTVNYDAPLVYVWNEEGSVIFQAANELYHEPLLQLPNTSINPNSEGKALQIKTNCSSNYIAVAYSVHHCLTKVVLQTFNVQTLEYRYIDRFKSNLRMFFETSNNAIAVVHTKLSYLYYLTCYTLCGDLLFEYNFGHCSCDFLGQRLCFTKDSKDLVFVTRNKVILFDVIQGTQKISFHSEVSLEHGCFANIVSDSILIVVKCDPVEGAIVQDVFNFKSGKKLYSVHISKLGFLFNMYRCFIWSEYHQNCPSKVIVEFKNKRNKRFSNPETCLEFFENKIVTVSYW